jgi:hypothetical protein
LPKPPEVETRAPLDLALRRIRLTGPAVTLPGPDIRPSSPRPHSVDSGVALRREDFMYAEYKQAWEAMTGPGGDFEITTVDVRGNPTRSCKP